MPVHNTDIAGIFDEIADFLEIEGENPFRIRAYRNAARTVSGLGSELKDMVAQEEDLTRLPGIGKELTAKIHEILETGTAKALIKLQQRIPQSIPQYPFFQCPYLLIYYQTYALKFELIVHLLEFHQIHHFQVELVVNVRMQYGHNQLTILLYFSPLLFTY